MVSVLLSIDPTLNFIFCLFSGFMGDTLSKNQDDQSRDTPGPKRKMMASLGGDDPMEKRRVRLVEFCADDFKVDLQPPKYQAVITQFLLHLENPPEKSVLLDTELDKELWFDPPTLFNNPKAHRKLWEAIRQTTIKNVMRVTSGASIDEVRGYFEGKLDHAPRAAYAKVTLSLKSWACTHCYKILANGSRRRDHECIHMNEKPHVCSTCSKGFAQLGDLRSHERIHSNEKPFKCLVCNATFRTSTAKTSHAKGHDPSNNMPCDQCDEKFSRRDHLQLHYKRKHKVQKDFGCDFDDCGKWFVTPGELKSHQRIHSGEKAFACGICLQLFSSKSNLNKHKDVHSEERNYTCAEPECTKTFKLKASWNHHIKLHRDERPFSCATCAKRFKTRGYLKKHADVHTGEQRYECDQCGQRFSQSGARNLHRSKHDDPSVFVCEYQDHSPLKYEGSGIPCSCALGFVSKLNLDFHVLKFHDANHKFSMPAELAVREAIESAFPGRAQFDAQNFFSVRECADLQDSLTQSKSYRFDVRTPAPDDHPMQIITEVDEYQHQRYPCDLKRMLLSAQVMLLDDPDIPVVFIRWNPDSRKIGAIHFNPSRKNRVEFLVRVLKNEPVLEGQTLSDLVCPGLNVVYLYYDLDLNDGPCSDRVTMLNNAGEENAVNASQVRRCVIATK